MKSELRNPKSERGPKPENRIAELPASGRLEASCLLGIGLGSESQVSGVAASLIRLARMHE
jgi:hypothetical protein